MKSRILGLFSILLLGSCKVKDNAQNDLNYMQNIEQVAIESSAKIQVILSRKEINWLF